MTGIDGASNEGAAARTVSRPSRQTRWRSAPDAAVQSLLGDDISTARSTSPAISTQGAGPQPLFFLTNNFNVIPVLASGYVRPRAGYEKYYRDLLDLANGWIPLIDGPVSSALCDVVSEEEFSFPVLLELSIPMGQVAELPRSPQLTGGASSDSATTGVLVNGIIPRTAITALHFRTQEEADSFTLREYEGVDYGDIGVRVTPGCFVDERTVGSAFLDWLRSVQVAPNVAPDAYRLADRVAGSLCAMLARLPDNDRDRRAAIFAAFNLETEGASPPLDERRALTAVLGFPRVDVVTAAPLEHDHVTIDDRLFSTAARILRDVDRFLAWDPAEIISQIRRLLESESATDAAELGPHLRYITRVIGLETDLKPFKSDSGHDSAKALVLVLLRPDLEELFTWDTVSLGATETIDFIAAYLAGALNGFEVLPLRYRPGTVNRAIAYWTSRYLNAGLATTLRLDPPDDVAALMPMATRAVSTAAGGGEPSDQRSASEIVQTSPAKKTSRRKDRVPSTSTVANTVETSTQTTLSAPADTRVEFRIVGDRLLITVHGPVETIDAPPIVSVADAPTPARGRTRRKTTPG